MYRMVPFQLGGDVRVELLKVPFDEPSFVHFGKGRVGASAGWDEVSLALERAEIYLLHQLHCETRSEGVVGQRGQLRIVCKDRTGPGKARPTQEVSELPYMIEHSWSIRLDVGATEGRRHGLGCRD